MDEKLRYSLLRDSDDDVSIWTRYVFVVWHWNRAYFYLSLCSNRHEKRLWFVTLMLGTCMLYSTRTSMPLLLPAIATDLKWSKTESGTVLSSFFWGYTVTQVPFSFHLASQLTAQPI